MAPSRGRRLVEMALARSLLDVDVGQRLGQRLDEGVALQALRQLHLGVGTARQMAKFFSKLNYSQSRGQLALLA